MLGLEVAILLCGHSLGCLDKTSPACGNPLWPPFVKLAMLSCPRQPELPASEQCGLLCARCKFPLHITCWASLCPSGIRGSEGPSFDPCVLGGNIPACVSACACVCVFVAGSWGSAGGWLELCCHEGTPVLWAGCCFSKVRMVDLGIGNACSDSSRSQASSMAIYAKRAGALCGRFSLCPCHPSPLSLSCCYHCLSYTVHHFLPAWALSGSRGVGPSRPATFLIWKGPKILVLELAWTSEPLCFTGEGN